MYALLSDELKISIREAYARKAYRNINAFTASLYGKMTERQDEEAAREAEASRKRAEELEREGAEHLRRETERGAYVASVGSPKDFAVHFPPLCAPGGAAAEGASGALRAAARGEPTAPAHLLVGWRGVGQAGSPPAASPGRVRSFRRSPPPPSAPPPPPEARRDLGIGQRVLVRWGNANYLGDVVQLDDVRATVYWVSELSRSEVLLSDVLATVAG